MKKTIMIVLLLLFAPGQHASAATTDANFTLDDGVADSPQLIFRDADDKDLTLQKTDAGAANIINTDGDMNFKPSNDTDDYILMNTAANAVFLGWEIAGLAYANDPGFRVDPATGKLQYRDQNGPGWTALADMASGSTATFASLTDVSLAGIARGDVLYWNGTDWVNLHPGNNGYFLKSQGAGADPLWADVTAAGVTLDKAYDQGKTITVDAGAVALTTPNTSNNQVFTATQNDTANNPIAVTIANTGTGNALFINQDGNGASVNIDTEATSVNAIAIDGTTMTTGSLLAAEIDDTLTANTALINITSTLANDDFRLIQATLTDGNGADVDAVFLDRNTNDARILYNDATEKWQIDQGDGLGLINIGAGSSGNVAGADTQVQFNDSLAFGADALFSYNKATDALTVSGMTFDAGSLTDATGAISFGNENLSTTGTFSSEDLASTDDADINDQMTAGNIVIDEAAGTLDFTGAGSAAITSSGSGSISFGDDNITTTGNATASDGTLAGGDLTIGAGATAYAGRIVLHDGDGGDLLTTTILSNANVGGSYTLTLPADDGGLNQVLQTDGNGVLSWVNAGSAAAGGADTQVQFNDGGSALGGDALLTYN
ncbi:MAG: hypothetical protein HQL30_11020, partial [Candidatus Omnitrophica bacterium]|nr:hypothetical protein [Candidatus Omnitrophota bacterium]